MLLNQEIVYLLGTIFSHGFGLFMGFVYNKKNIEYHQTYPFKTSFSCLCAAKLHHSVLRLFNKKKSTKKDEVVTIVAVYLYSFRKCVCHILKCAVGLY